LTDQATIYRELETLTESIDHIEEIVAMQQSYALVAGVVETMSVAEAVEDAVRMNAAALEREGIRVVREYQDVPPVSLQRHRVLRILVNLIRDAEHAMSKVEQTERQLTLRVNHGDGDKVQVSVIDNGIGILAENLTRIFEYGFTTRKGGHGFALHNGALSAEEMGGALLARSDGPGKGATFILELPLAGTVKPR
jgi:signal transduction histidine kinase